MRVIVPLQGVVQGTGGLFWGSVIPCALFYFLQLYFRNRHQPHPQPSPLPDQEVSAALHRCLSFPRTATASAHVSTRANSLAADSPYYVGLHKVADNPYHQVHNPTGVIQLGLPHNTVSSFLSSLLFSSLVCYSQQQPQLRISDSSPSMCSYVRT